MASKLRVLIIEDVEDHALLIVRELQKGGLDIFFERVETVEELSAALEEAWDVIISDYSLPGFNGIDALHMVQQKGLDAPFLLVSGAIGEEKAAEVMKAGAQDYIRKGNYARLVPTLERELRDAKVRRERRQTAEELARHREHLEELVQERTAELVRVNDALQAEIAERMQAQEALQDAETHYRTLFESIDEGYCIIEVLFDQEERPVDYLFLTVNPAFEKQSGLSNAVGKRMRELAPKHEEYWFEIYGRIALSGESVRFQRPAEQLHRWYDLYAFRLGPPERRQVAVLFNDITERKDAEERLRKSEAKFAKIFHANPSLVTISALSECEVIDVNETVLPLLGYRRDEVIGRCTSDLGIWIDEGERADVVATVAEQGSIRQREVALRHKSGATVIGLLSAELITLDQQPCMLSFVRDITERKQAAQEIAKLNKELAARLSEMEERNQELEAFNRMVSHDLRQPLNAIGLSCQGLRMFCSVHDENCAEWVRNAAENVARMNGLIETLLRFSRSTHGELQRKNFDLSAVAGEVVEELRRSEPQRRVRVEVAEGVMAYGDPDFLRAVLDNLIGNAWKYTGNRKEALIEFGVREVCGSQAYFVRDNGRGFDMADADRLFAPFQRLAGAEEFRGSGIGLATVQRIVRRHGGQVWAEGEPEKGSTFYFTLDDVPVEA